MQLVISEYLRRNTVDLDIDLIDIKIVNLFMELSSRIGAEHLNIDGRIYHWLSYQKIIDELPIINIKSKRTIARRLDALVDKGIFERVIYKDRYTYFRIAQVHNMVKENNERK